ncbi:isochorismate synthase [Nakamurella leprariae]|uniref:isochorismate synthase n=1 Tax=Nakamurella leprariae TaxID=2803911 RepID=A0A938Y9T9_9ACTN|nr:isochorismate synthase [Nakamurella leprariae]MBM9466592.1 isochorismate synthase [Nakamurella leprariae]
MSEARASAGSERGVAARPPAPAFRFGGGSSLPGDPVDQRPGGGSDALVWRSVTGGRWLDGTRAGLADRVAAVLAAHPDTMVGGALPFERDAAAVLVHGPVDERPALPVLPAPREPAPVLLGVESRPDPVGYRDAVRRALDWIADGPAGPGQARKVVLSRALLLEYSSAVDPDAVLAAAAATPGRTWRYQLRTPAGPVLVGATPELLVRRRGLAVTSFPLAGSTPRPGGAADADQAARLRASAKDHREHAVVVEAIADTLAPWCRRLTVPSEPELVAAPGMWHLGSHIRGELRDPSVTSLHLAAALAPTPALGGRPAAAAAALIGQLEPDGRGLYGGTVGWTDGSGDGEWAVTIRGALLDGARVRVQAGAGIVAASEPEAELHETTAKVRAVLAALALPGGELR